MKQELKYKGMYDNFRSFMWVSNIVSCPRWVNRLMVLEKYVLRLSSHRKLRRT